MSCWDIGVDKLKSLDKMPSCKAGLHYPSRIQELQVEKLFRKPRYCVMGRIDMFALLKL